MTCTKCKKPKPDDRYKWCPRCREQQRLASQKWASKHYVKKPRKPRLSAAERKRRRRAWYARNAERERARSLAWQRVNPERWREINRAAVARHKKAHPADHAARQARRRALQAEVSIGDFTLQQLEQRLSMYAGCWICGTPEWEHVDHVKPLSKSGPHILANLRPACGPCNIRKGATWPLP